MNLIPSIFPSKRTYFRLRSLLETMDGNDSEDDVIISHEINEHKREFFNLTIDELRVLYELIPITKRSFYECIVGNKPIKLYIDFEY